jgi:hypothetical protein
VNGSIHNWGTEKKIKAPNAFLKLLSTNNIYMKRIKLKKNLIVQDKIISEMVVIFRMCAQLCMTIYILPAETQKMSKWGFKNSIKHVFFTQ